MKILKESSGGIASDIFMTGCIVLALAVIAGAFGAHALQSLLDEKSKNTYHTAVNYHFYHGFALILCGLAKTAANPKRLQWTARFFSIGLLLFCGSLYTLSLLTAADNHSFRWLGAITPFGGLSFIIGWLLMARAMYK
jgi:uncharacterized membrane protein YgdD (TMEM256/DUF423 family)